MEENRLLEAMWREAQQVEIPPELAPEQMKENICSQPGTKENRRKNKKEGKHKNHAKHVFHWHGYAGRVAAAASFAFGVQ